MLKKYKLLLITKKRTWGVSLIITSDVVVNILNEITKDKEFGRVTRYLNAKPKSNSIVLAKTEEGIPLIAMNDLGAGKVVYYGIYDSKNGFKFSPSYPIFWDELIKSLTQKDNIEDYNKKTEAKS